MSKIVLELKGEEFMNLLIILHNGKMNASLSPYEGLMHYDILSHFCNGSLKRLINHQRRYTLNLKRYEAMAIHKFLQGAYYTSPLLQACGNKIFMKLDQGLCQQM